MKFSPSCFRWVLRRGGDPERLSLMSPASETLRSCPSGSWRRSWPGITSIIQVAVRSGSWWSESVDSSERGRRAGDHVGINHVGITHTASQPVRSRDFDTHPKFQTSPLYSSDQSWSCFSPYFTSGKAQQPVTTIKLERVWLLWRLKQ